MAHLPAMHVSGGSPSSGRQQSRSVTHLSSCFAHIFIMGGEQVPMGSMFSCGGGKLHVPPQQSTADVQVLPSFLHGSSAANAR